MNKYEVRFIRKGGVVFKNIWVDATSDKEIIEHVINTWPQRPSEIWEGDRSVMRRVPRAYDSDYVPIYESNCIYPALNISNTAQVGRDKPIPYEQFQHIGLVSMRLFRDVRDQMGAYGVWVYATGHPLLPPSIERGARFSVKLVTLSDELMSGYTNCDVWSILGDGDDILEDISDLALISLHNAHMREGISYSDMGYVERIAKDGLFLYKPSHVSWIIRLDSC